MLRVLCQGVVVKCILHFTLKPLMCFMAMSLGGILRNYLKFVQAKDLPVTVKLKGLLLIFKNYYWKISNL